MQIKLFDFLFLLALFGGATLGFYRGFFRQAVGTVVIYASTVVSAIGYRSISRMVSGATGQPTPASDVLSFIVLMAVMNFLIGLMGNDLISHIDISRMKVWVNLSGMIFGFINAAFWCAVLLIVIRSATSGEKWFGYESIQMFLRNQTHGSSMAYVFRPVMRLVLVIIKPWLFGHSIPPLLIDAL